MIGFLVEENAGATLATCVHLYWSVLLKGIYSFHPSKSSFGFKPMFEIAEILLASNVSRPSSSSAIAASIPDSLVSL